MATWNLGNLVASALPTYEKEFKDQIFNETPTLNHLKENGGVVQKSGGTSIRVPLMHSRGTSEWFGGTDSLNVAPVDTLDAAEFTWRNLNASIVFTLDEELANSGAEQVIDLLEAKVTQAKLTIADALATSIFTGTGAEARPQIVGLQTLVGTGSVGGINGATYADWKAYVEATGGALTIAYMKTARNTVNQGKGGAPVSLMPTTQTLFEKYESLLTPTYQMDPMVRTKEVVRLGDVGFTALSYAGVPVVLDSYTPAGEMYLLNTKNLKLFVHKDAFMDKTEAVRPTNQHVSVQHIVVRCALGTNRRKSLGKLTGKTA
jgi:hypothetical protein